MVDEQKNWMSHSNGNEAKRFESDISERMVCTSSKPLCVCIQLNRRVHNKPFERCYPYINYRNLVVGHCNIFWVFVWFWLANVNIWNRNWSTNIRCEVFESNCTNAIQNKKTTIVFTNCKEPPYYIRMWTIAYVCERNEEILDRMVNDTNQITTCVNQFRSETKEEEKTSTSIQRQMNESEKSECSNGYVPEFILRFLVRVM